MTLGARSHLIHYAPGGFTLVGCTQFRGLSALDHAMHLPVACPVSGWLAAEVRCEEDDMYCSNCHRPVFYNDPEKQGWCEKCQRIVKVSPCSVSHWYVAAALLLPWLMTV